MTAIPQLDVPDILVDDEDDRERAQSKGQRATMGGPLTTTDVPPALLAAADAFRAPHQSWAPGSDLASARNSPTHPLSLPRSPPSMPRRQTGDSAFSFEIQDPASATATAGGGGGGTGQFSTPGSARNSRNNSRNNSVNNSRSNSRNNSRHNSAAEPSQGRDLLDDSVWMESIRRSATVRKSQRGSFR